MDFSDEETGSKKGKRLWRERKRVNKKAKSAKSEETDIIDLLGTILPGLETESSSILSPTSNYPIGDHPNGYLSSFSDDKSEEGSAAELGDAAESTWTEQERKYQEDIQSHAHLIQDCLASYFWRSSGRRSLLFSDWK